MSYELDRITPFNAEDAYYDLQIIVNLWEAFSFITAAKADFVKPYIDALA